jgi:hypothetical protein
MVRLMQMVLPLILLLTITATTEERADQPGNAQRNHIGVGQVRPAMILSGTGTAAGLVETITPAEFGSRKTWRIVHYPQDPAATQTNEYDLYDLDQVTLAPLRSVMSTAENHLELIFSEKKVLLRRTTAQGESTEQIPLSTNVQAEGPGLDVFVAALPLAVGYRTRYAIVDRWGGNGASRVKAVVLSVGKRTTEQTSVGKVDIYELLIKPDDDSFQIREKVLAESPHFPLRVEYTRDGKPYPPSEVIAMISQP